jgi:hypothetical protein
MLASVKGARRFEAATRIWCCFAVSRWSLPSLVLSWLLVWSMLRVSLPPVDPSLSPRRPLEPLASFGLVLPVTLQTMALAARSPWQLAVAVRNVPALRAVWLIVVLTVSASCCLLVAWAGALPIRQFLMLWVLLTAAAMAGLTVVGAAFVALPPFVLLSAFSLGHGVPPWSWNLVYNVDRVDLLTWLGCAGGLLTFVSYLHRGDRVR